MNLIKHLILISTGFVMIFLAGCSKEPVGDIAVALKTLNDAKAADADVYASELYGSAQKLYDNGVKEIDRQKSKIFFVRNYSQASKMLKEALTTAKNAEESVEENKMMMKSEADDLIAQAEISIEETKKLITTAKRKRLKVATIQEKYDALVERLDVAKEAMGNDNIATAKEGAQSVLIEIVSVKEELEEFLGVKTSLIE